MSASPPAGQEQPAAEHQAGDEEPTTAMTVFPRRKSGQPPKRKDQPRVSVQITKAHLEARFHLPLPEAAKDLGICTTAAKKLCRKLGILKWPYCAWKERYTPRQGRRRAAEGRRDGEEDEDAAKPLNTNGEYDPRVVLGSQPHPTWGGAGGAFRLGLGQGMAGPQGYSSALAPFLGQLGGPGFFGLGGGLQGGGGFGGYGPMGGQYGFPGMHQLQGPLGLGGGLAQAPQLSALIQNATAGTGAAAGGDGALSTLEGGAGGQGQQPPQQQAQQQPPQQSQSAPDALSSAPALGSSPALNSTFVQYMQDYARANPAGFAELCLQGGGPAQQAQQFSMQGAFGGQYGGQAGHFGMPFSGQQHFGGQAGQFGAQGGQFGGAQMPQGTALAAAGGRV